MAPNTLSDFLHLLISLGRDLAAALAFLLLSGEHRMRREIEEWRRALGWALVIADQVRHSRHTSETAAS